MHKSLFSIQEMDCPSEEQLIRMKLASLDGIRELQFDLQNRNLIVLHEGDLEPITDQLASLNLGSRFVESSVFEGSVSTHQMDHKLLVYALIINFSFFVIEGLSGFWAGSMGLVADSLDMLADAFVYALSLYAISGALSTKKGVAILSGVLQLMLAVPGLMEVVRRFIYPQANPEFQLMMFVSGLALMANVATMWILKKSSSQEVHIQASQIFTSSDIMANAGVMLAGLLVWIFHSPLPDLLVGAVVFVLILRGSFRIFKLAR